LFPYNYYLKVFWEKIAVIWGVDCINSTDIITNFIGRWETYERKGYLCNRSQIQL